MMKIGVICKMIPLPGSFLSSSLLGPVWHRIHEDLSLLCTEVAFAMENFAIHCKQY